MRHPYSMAKHMRHSYITAKHGRQCYSIPTVITAMTVELI